MNLPLFILSFFLYFKASHCAGQLELLENGGYTDLVVAIHPSVTEDLRVLTGLQRLLVDGSKHLYQSTRQKVYFKSVTVAVPETWNRQPDWQDSGQETYENAEIQVSPTDINYGDSPRVARQGVDCGIQAGTVVLTPKFLLQAHEYNLTNGDNDPARWFVRLWAQFRYGIFDEHGYAASATYPFFYFSQTHQMAMPTSCATADLLFGDIIDATTGLPCTNFTGGFPGPNCEYLLHPTMDPTSSSITYAHQYGMITEFCDDTPERLHNSEAPTKQNLYCNGRSTWDVISNSPDFRGKPAPPEVPNTTPQLKVTYSTPHRYVIVYDASASTNGTIISMYQRAITKWVWYDVSARTQLGSVAFSDKAWTLSNITTMATPADRQEFIASVPNQGDGSTCIGCGLMEGLEVLARGGSTAGGVLIVVTDGLENGQPTVHDLVQIIKDSGVTVHWISFGDTMGSQLSLLVESTRGRAFHLYESMEVQGASEMASALFEIVSIKERSKLLDTTLEANEKTITGRVIIDEAIGFDTAITVMYEHEATVPYLVVLGPNGSQHCSSFNESSYGIVAIDIPYTKPGNWRYLIDGLDVNSTIAVAVTSGIRDKKKAVAVEGWTNYLITSKKRPVAIFAEVRSGSMPVISATAIAQVQRPGGDIVSITLLDDGADPDFEKDDGVYSRYFTQVDGIGHYSVVVVARDDNNGSLHNGQQGLSGQDSRQPFQRAVTVGSFSSLSAILGRELVNDTMPQEEAVDIDDVLPPSRIFDLAITSQDAIRREITLQWTSPGDDYDHGSAHLFQLTITANNQTRILDITDPSTAAGTVASAVISLAQFDDCLLQLNIRAVDEVGNLAGNSNALQFSFSPPEGERPQRP